MELTTNENKVINVIVECQKGYDKAGEIGFSDVMLEDIIAESGLDVKVTKGIIGSLVKKGLIHYMDVNEEYNIYYLTNEGRKQFNMEEGI